MKNPMNPNDNNRELGKQFLAAMHAREISRYESDTQIVIHYEIDILLDLTEVWIENESKLEAPEYYYSLHQSRRTIT